MSRRPTIQKISHSIARLYRRRFARAITVALVFSIIGSLLIYFSFAQRNEGSNQEGPIPAAAPNPQIVSQSCLGGLNVALLADVSGSIYDHDEYVAQMKDALKAFVSNLLPSTHTMFSLTKFGDEGTVLVPFTNNISTLTTAINNLSEGGGTNWTAGIQAAYSTFSSIHSNSPGVLIIATDGEPRSPRGSAISSAVEVANNVKTMGIHMLAVGIGEDPTVSSLQAISGPKINDGGVNSDVVLTDFASLGAALQLVARSTCSSGTGSGGSGTGTGGNGNGTGGTGNGTGIGGTGSGSNGTGTGTIGKGTGTSGSGKGTTGTGTGKTVGKTPQPSPTPVPTATQGTTPSPSPTPTPSPEPAPTPAATETTQPQPPPAPTPTAVGIRTKPPQPQPSPFYDGKQFAPGSMSDDFDPSPVKRQSNALIYAIGGVAVFAAIGGTIIWRRHATASDSKKPAKVRKR